MDEEIQQIRELYNNEKYGDCLSLSAKILKENVNNFTALSYKASSLLHLELYKESIDSFSDCLKLDDSLFYIWVLRGDAYCEINDYEKAFSDYWVSLQLEPNNGAVLDKIGRTLFLLGDENRAMEYMKKSIDLSESCEPIMVMMFMLNKMGMYGFTQKLYELGTSKFPTEKDRFDKYLNLK